MKRLFAQVLTASILMAQLLQPVAAQTATTIAGGAHSPLSRAGAVALIISADAASAQRAEWLSKHMPPLQLFSDVHQTEWYAPYLEVAFERGIITGNNDGRFRPNDALTEQEAMALAVRLHDSTHADDGVYLSILSESNPNSLGMLLYKSQEKGIRLPSPMTLMRPISRDNLFAMVRSAGITSPESVNIAFFTIPWSGPAKTVTQIVNTPQPARTTTVATMQPVRNTVSKTRVVAQAPAPSPLQANVTSPAPVGNGFTVSMPTLGISNLTITHPTDFSHDGLLAPLKNGVGHLFSYPGQGGKILVYGHSSGYPWDVSKYTKIFRQINKLNVGDLITVTYGGSSYTYKVTLKQAVDAADTSPYAQEGREELILYTCWPPDSIKQRYLVHAVPVETIAQR